MNDEKAAEEFTEFLKHKTEEVVRVAEVMEIHPLSAALMNIAVSIKLAGAVLEAHEILGAVIDSADAKDAVEIVMESIMEDVENYLPVKVAMHEFSEAPDKAATH